MTETSWNETPGLLRDVHEGMTVRDSAGEEIGTVAAVKMGDTGVVTGAGQELPTDDDLITTAARAVWGGPAVPDQEAARLTRLGGIRVDRPFARDAYAAADQIARVEDDVVRLNVLGDELVHG